MASKTTLLNQVSRRTRHERQTMIKSGSTRRRRFGAFVAVPLVAHWRSRAAVAVVTTAAMKAAVPKGARPTASASRIPYRPPVSPFETLAEQYAEETGVEVETIALPGENYGVTLRTQLQGGNAPDSMVVSPGSGRPSGAPSRGSGPP